MKTTNKDAFSTEDMQQKPLMAAWLALGIVISLACSILIISLYGLIDSNAKLYRDNPIESDENLETLYKTNQILYRDLYNKVNNTDLSYSELYYPGTEIFIENQNIDTEDEEYNLISQIWYKLSKVDNYLNNLEFTFTAMNDTYDYLIKDTNTGQSISNTAKKDALDPAEYYFYLTFCYDANGNLTIGETVQGENKDKIRKYVSEFARNPILPSNDYITEIAEYQEYITEQKISNCEITYGITNEMWGVFQNNNYTISGINIFRNTYNSYMSAGFGNYFLLIALAVFLLAFFLPAAGRGEPWNTVRIFRVPFETAVLIAIVIYSCVATYSVAKMAVLVYSGRTANKLFELFGGSSDFYKILAYCGNVLYLAVMFAAVWYVGIVLRQIRKDGIRKYIKSRCLIYRFFPFIKGKCHNIYEEYVHFDVTKNAKKKIVKLVLINAATLLVVRILWIGGFLVLVVYSLVLYLIFKKYVSDLQKKYGILLNATNEIAEGNLNVSITEDLGIYEPFKPQIIRIQRGFKNAVEEEVKSQRMKSELITNVSHDLKTPLTAIITYIGLLKDENITQQQRTEYLNTLEKKSFRLKVLIEDLFEVSKATSKSVTLNIMDVDVMNLVKQVELEMSDKLEATGLDIRMNLTTAKILLPLDSQKTYRIYENLFGNIAKYALRGTRVYVNGFQIDDTIIITLKNITAQELEVSPQELTDRFVRGDSSRNTEGSGLGLAIAKSFTELQGGKLEIEIDGDLFKVTTIWKLPELASKE